jgi:uncharacterized protein
VAEQGIAASDFSLAVVKKSRIGKEPTEGQLRPCPICGKRGAFATRPFCSKRCAAIDLYRWLGGIYAIAAPSTDESGADGNDAGEHGEQQGIKLSGP